jgi:tRNA A-37 threonylcarbamoyl transferase component Bud32
MNIAQGMELGHFIIMLYNNDLDINEKNKILLSVLQTIANKLQELQESCGFIHGDLNVGNVFVNFDEVNETAPPEITFIDYGYSSVRLLFENGTDLIVTSPTEINITRSKPFDIRREPHLRAVDMYHLIDDLSSIDDNDGKFKHKKYYSAFKEFINKIKSSYNLINTKITRRNKTEIGNFNRTKQNRRKFTTSGYFMIDNERYKILLPENFLNIELNTNGEILLPKNFFKIELNANGKIINTTISNVKQQNKVKSMFGNNNNN